jgi:hypothetical protein
LKNLDNSKQISDVQTTLGYQRQQINDVEVQMNQLVYIVSDDESTLVEELNRAKRIIAAQERQIKALNEDRESFVIDGVRLLAIGASFFDQWLGWRVR